MICTNCDLCITRDKIVKGEGAANKIMFIGEAPGYHENKIGKPFVGLAGQHLNIYLYLFGLDRPNDVFIDNIVKCRPPSNRTPYDIEIKSCLPYVKENIILNKPKVIVLLGSTAVRALLHCTLPINKLRGKYYGKDDNIIITYHPSYALQNINMTYKNYSLNKELFYDFRDLIIPKYRELVNFIHLTNL
jgi:DNA polymerase